MHHIFFVLEILETILELADKQTQARCAQVCRRWSDVALNLLWAEISTVRDLFSILSPYKYKVRETSPFEFATHPRRVNWLSFESYSRRVRRISLPANFSLHLYDAILDGFCRTRPHDIHFFPRLHTLTWPVSYTGSATYPLIFMHKNLTRLTLSIASDPDEDVAYDYVCPFFDDVAWRVPLLTHLEIQTKSIDEDDLPEFRNATTELIQGLTRLECLTIPPFWMTGAMLEKLSSVENLREIHVGSAKVFGIEFEYTEFTPTFSIGSFSSLVVLELSIDFPNAIRLVGLQSFSANIKTFCIQSPICEPPLRVRVLLAAMNSKFPRIEKFLLHSCDLVTNHADAGTAPAESIVELVHLQPVYAFRNLVHFEIRHPYPLGLDQNDIEEIASELPSTVELLVLNDDPTLFRSGTQLTLLAILPFARHLPHLKVLGLFMDAVAIDGLVVQDPPCFKNLEKLVVGVSDVAGHREVGMYLSKLLMFSSCCEIQARSQITTAEPIARIKRWQPMNELLPLLTAARREEASKRSAFQREAELLQRIRVLEEGLSRR
ncbi:hypothetical protein B0H10DRAFT_2011722 [Mycena sp. CBHHK59/15]|nr:hypothetical protein B0H10DRAFT_2011722 [Mycena sp. CBHHK59/15]